jgi:hypothetical protein
MGVVFKPKCRIAAPIHSAAGLTVKMNLLAA